jgi:hypothetical protein
MEEQRQIKAIPKHAQRYGRDGFPRLPGYGAYVQRLNRIAACFPSLLEQVAHALPYEELYADKAYEYLQRVRGLPCTVLTPVKQRKGQAHLDAADAWLSRAVSPVRQPAESIFNWIEEKTGIEIASKVRSSQGLLVHVFGRLAAAMFVRNVLPLSA